MAWLKMLDLLVILNMTDDDDTDKFFILSFFLFHIFMGREINPFSLINKCPIKIMANLLVNLHGRQKSCGAERDFKTKFFF